MRAHPSPVVKQQRGLFLCTGQRQPEIVVVSGRDRHAAGLVEHTCNVVVRQRRAVDTIQASRHVVFAEQLHRPDAVTTERGEKIGTLVRGRDA